MKKSRFSDSGAENSRLKNLRGRASKSYHNERPNTAIGGNPIAEKNK
ncbi:hypothetical protein [Legionella jamestowniensis]|nr:hypothetical protein [Legionella jamestowniensis]SFM04554.1 hypothetical protein SAMN02746073_0134 [Legionella jamestowniensis DSM 19215]